MPPDDALAREFTATYLRVRYDSIDMFDDVMPVLQTLRGRYVLGVISNGNTRADRCGLPDMFDFELYAEDFGGACKPDRPMFDAAMEAAGCSRGELAHVGDSLENDVLGALGVGAVAVWLNRSGVPNATNVRPTHEIRGLDELPSVLASPGLATMRPVP